MSVRPQGKAAPRRAFVPFALAFAALAGACANPAPSAAGPSAPAPTATATIAPTATSAPPPAGTLRVAVTGAAPHLDMHATASEWAALFGPGPSHGRLMRFVIEEGAPSTLETECDLCESWRFTDAATLDFALSPNGRWQPAEGFASRPVTPQDVVFSFNRMREPGRPHAALFDAVESAEPRGERGVRFNLRYPDPDLPLKLASPYAAILAPETLDGVDARTQPVAGAGPWLYRRSASGQATLTAWEGHATGVKAESIEFHPAANRPLTARLLLQGRVDMAQVSESDWPALEEAGFSSSVVKRPGGRGTLFGLNAARPPFDDREVRRAAFLALSPQDALDGTLGVGSASVGVPLADERWIIGEDEFASAFGDAARARRTLERAGGGRRVRLVVANFGEARVSHGRLLGAQLEAAGFDVEAEVLSRAAYLRRVWEERDYDAFVGPMPPADAPNGFLLGLTHSRGAFNVTGGTAELDALIERQATETDGEARGGLAREIQRVILSEALFFMAAGAAERWALSDRVTGFVPHFPMGAGDLWAFVSAADGGGARR